MRFRKILTATVLAMLVASTIAVSVPTVKATDGTLFKITLVAPGTANLLRRQWGLIIANSFQSVGIDARVVFLTWGSVYDRILTPDPSLIGKTYDEGGWDALLIGWTPGAPATPFLGTFQIYYSKNTPPNSNYFLWNNSGADLAIETMLTKGYTTEGITAFKNWQAIQAEELPASQIFYQQAVIAAHKDLNFNGYEWLFDNTGPVPQFLTGGITSVTLGTTGELLDLNPPLSNSWYDTLVYNPIFDQLFFLDNNFNYVPSLATGYSVSADGRTYVYNLRSGVKFHDGEVFDADDVLFSFLGYLHPATGSQQYALTAGYVGEDITFTWLNGTVTRLVVDLEKGEGYYPANATTTKPRKAYITATDATTVNITIADFGTLGKPAATFHPEGDMVPYIIPKHVLETVPFADWKTHPFNKATGTYVSRGQTFSGPIGLGPYKFKSWDPVTALVTTEKFTDYWNKTALEGDGFFGVQNYYVRYIEGKDAAVAALKNNEVQIIDQNYQLQNDYVAGNLGFAATYVLKASGIQQLGYNMRHPVFGTGVDTPLGKQNPSRAAEAARYVRQAMDYLIPRSLIINNLLGGLADPAIVHVNPLSPYYNTSITAREYNPTKAKELLAKAGYTVGVTPGGPTVLSSYLLGQTVTLSGTFSFDTVAGQQEGGIVVLLEMSTDNVTWRPVAQGITTTGGYYSLGTTPNATGSYYFRVVLTGVGAKTAAASSATGPTFPYDGLTKAVASQVSPVTRVNVTSIDDAIASFRNSVNSQLSTLNSQLQTLTSIAYGGVAVGVVGVIVAVVAVMRKRAPTP